MSRRRLVLVALLATCSIAPFFALRASGGATQEIVVFASTALGTGVIANPFCNEGVHHN